MLVARKPLHQRTDSQANARGIRLVSPEPLLLGAGENVVPGKPVSLAALSQVSIPGSISLHKDVSDRQNEFQTPIRRQPKDALNSASVPTLHEDGQIVTPTANRGPVLSATKRNPLPKKRLVVRLRDGQKTFSLIAQEEPIEESETDPTPIKPSAASSHTVASLPNSTTSCAPESSFPSESTLVATPPSLKSRDFAALDASSTSPWNYQFVGGLRKVAKTPDLKLSAGSADNEHHSQPVPSVIPYRGNQLSKRASFRSIDSVTTVSEGTNYKVYRERASHSHTPSLSDADSQTPVSPVSRRSLPFSEPPSPLSESGETSKAPQDSIDELVRELSLTPESVIHRPDLAEDGENYILHGEASPEPSFSGVHLAAKTTYSQESLVVKPLRPLTKRSTESFGYFKQRSRETLRTVGSFTSITSVLSQQEASRAIIGTPSIVTLPFPPQSRAAKAVWLEPGHSPSRQGHMSETPHVWSSQLSAVLSVSDGGTNRASHAWSDDAARRSGSTPRTNSRSSRHVLSLDTEGMQEHAGSAPVSAEIQQAAMTHGLQRYLNESPALWLSDHHNEHQDVITPMQDLRARSSRRFLGTYAGFDAENGRTSTMKSTASSIANSVLVSSIPTWARVYYGSGERKYLVAPGSSHGSSGDRSNSYLTTSGSPITDHFPSTLYSPRRRPREIAQRNRAGSMEIHAVPGRSLPQQDIYTRHLRTWSMSSMWSPHLRHDRRSNKRISIWEPPSVNWSTEGSVFGRRNVQIVMFILGFIFPFTWMIAAFLPLPPGPDFDEKRSGCSTEDLPDTGRHRSRHDYFRNFGPSDEARYENATWWRRLNRWMCLVGVAIITVVTTLAIVGTKRSW